ncbi:MAG: UDP-glucuronic acid decarboxylase family protein [Candidatus Brocadiia bacterium]
MKRILIAGGAGFIGSHLCDYFRQGGNQVICLDNLITGTKNNIKHLLGKPGFSFIKHDIAQPLKLAGPLYAILDFASPASPKDYLEYPIETLKAGSIGTYNLLELARAKKARFLLASTSEVYGDPLQHPQPESYWGNVNPVGVRSVYDEAKRFAEALTMSYFRYHKLDTRIVRIFNTYGPRMRLKDGRALPNFFAQAITGQPITIYGKGSQTRSFCYVDDMVRGIARLLDSREHMPVNLGNPSEIPIRQLAREIKDICRSNSSVRIYPLPQDDPKIRRPDITRARKILKWQPEISRPEGLKRTYLYFRRLLSGF